MSIFKQYSGVVHTVPDITPELWDKVKAGDKIFLTNDVLAPIRLTDKNFEIPICISSRGKIELKEYKGTCIEYQRCRGIITEGINTRKGLYAFHGNENSNLLFTGMDCRDVGQEMFKITTTTDEAYDNIQIRATTMIGSGKKNKQYGEMIYVGNGSDPGLGVITNVLIDDCYIRDFTNEVIDIKGNCDSSIVTRNNIAEGEIIFNGVITIENTGWLGKRNSRHIIANNTISDVRQGRSSLINYICFGTGNIEIHDNKLTCHPSHVDKTVAIRGFTTFNNRAAKDVHSFNNEMIGFREWFKNRPHYGDSGTGLNYKCDFYQYKRGS
mgnify:CR=1 FL=1